MRISSPAPSRTSWIAVSKPLLPAPSRAFSQILIAGRTSLSHWLNVTRAPRKLDVSLVRKLTPQIAAYRVISKYPGSSALLTRLVQTTCVSYVLGSGLSSSSCKDERVCTKSNAGTMGPSADGCNRAPLVKTRSRCINQRQLAPGSGGFGLVGTGVGDQSGERTGLRSRDRTRRERTRLRGLSLSATERSPMGYSKDNQRNEVGTERSVWFLRPRLSRILNR